jgi:predicted anti-sigma-YlaC factor YlaD
MRGRPGGCRIHREALLDFVDRRELGPGTPAALEHLDRCDACRNELATVVLAIHAVRRLLAEARAVEPPGDAWERLSARVQRPATSAWRARSAVAGVVVSAGLVAALVGPAVVWGPRGLVEGEPGPGPDIVLARTVAEQRAEAAFLSRVKLAPAIPERVSEFVPAAVYWAGPDGLGRTEVPVAPDAPLAVRAE